MSGDLINTVEAPGEFDALTSLRPGEPYFLLVGRDRLAPKLVQKWADERRKLAIADFESGKINADTYRREIRKCTQAEAIGWAMQAYKAGNESRAAIAESRPTYTGHEVPAETKRADAVQSAKIRASTAINGAVAELVSLMELLGEPCTELDNPTVASLKKLSDEIMPARPLPAGRGHARG